MKQITLSDSQVAHLIQDAAIRVCRLHLGFREEIAEGAIMGDLHGEWTEFERVNELLTDLTVQSSLPIPPMRLDINAARRFYHELCDDIYVVDMHKIRRDGKPCSNPDGIEAIPD